MERNIADEIEKLRELMVNEVHQKGITHSEVIKISQMLDLLHVEYIKKQKEKKYTQKIVKDDTFKYRTARCC